MVTLAPSPSAGSRRLLARRRRRPNDDDEWGRHRANGSGGYDRIFFLKRASDEEALYLAARLV
jgi:hypothetical protein